MSRTTKKMTELEDLSPEQRAVVESWGQGMAVLAGAGSGKTTTLTIKCAELLKRNVDARFAAVSFTERSASDLRAKLTSRLSALEQAGVLPGRLTQAGVLSRHWVMTIHGLCSTILREYPREAGFDGEETMLSEPEAQLLWERALESLWLDDELPPEVRQGVDLLLERESRDSASQLLRRVRDLHSLGILNYLAASRDPASQALAQTGRFALERYERLKRRRGALDFNDLERGADRVLDIPAIREAFHRRFELVLVDEFQDTNPVQARILHRFVRPDRSNLCVVGDPKQSIYRFRDADVSLFEEFCAGLPVQKTLSWNFRSRPGIIDYANQLCAQAFEASQMRYDPLVPKREAGAFEPVVRLDAPSPKALAEWIRAETARGVGLHEMALLLRKIRGNEKWLKALTSAGIPIAVGSGGLFWSDPRVRECVALLKWWDNPGNSLSGGIFLRAPWMGIDDVELDAWIKKDPTWREPFFASSHPVAQALGRLRYRIVRPGELLMELLVSEDIEAECGAPLLGLWHRAEELSSRGLDFHAAVAELAACCQEERRERDVPPPRNQGQLSVLTLHGSKGLEFPHVILIDLGKKGKAPNAPLLFWDREKGAYLGARDADGERDKSHPEEAAWRASEKSKNLAESKRVFYVALTRAQERLVLVCPELEDYEAPPAEKAFAEDDWRAWVECAGVSLPRAELSGAPVAAPSGVAQSFGHTRPAQLPAPRATRPRHSVTEWNLMSRCERAYEWTYVRPVAVPQDDLFASASKPGRDAGVMGLPNASPNAFPNAFPNLSEDTSEAALLSQRELGTRVHGCLERGDFEELKRLEREAGAGRFIADPVIEWARTSEWMKPANLAQGRDVWTELAFEVSVRLDAERAPEILVGSLDRLVLERAPPGGSRYSIIDFKVTDKPKSAQELCDAYGTQMELYAMGLKRLDPTAGEPAAVLVNISAGSVHAVEVPLGRITPEDLARRASEIVAGRAGQATACELCRFCDFRAVCDVGRGRSRR